VITRKFTAFLRSDSGRLGALRRLVVITLVAWPMLGIYMVIDRCQSGPPTTVSMPSWVPFWPAFLPVYWVMLLATWLMPVAIRDAARFRACMWAMVCGWLLVMPWWILTPTTLPRPPLPEGSWSGAFQMLWAMDPPNNVMPCAHGTGPTVAAWFLGRDRPTWRWPLAALLVIGLPSIALTWQHRPLDVLLGMVAAGVGIVVVETSKR
jgi:hypothetical protein